MFTIDDLAECDFSVFKYDYQSSLTEKLDNSQASVFDQNIINEIVLWKLNRYTAITNVALSLLNSDEIKKQIVNRNFTKQVIGELLKIKGIRLPMASAILRFRNPTVYQIIDQRAYRFVYGTELNLTEPKNEKIVDQQTSLYLDYLDKLKRIAIERSWQFSQMDRILYALDIVHNKEINIKT